MSTLMTFGDSNTFGAMPLWDMEVHERLSPSERWPGVALNALGPSWQLREEGLPGRTICRPDAEMGDHMDGRTGLLIAAGTSSPIDVLTIMLGSNDLKAQFGVNAGQMADDVAALLDLCDGELVRGKHPDLKTLLIAPPMPFESGILKERFSGCAERGDGFADSLRCLADERGVAFLDANTVISCDPLDGVHFGAAAHVALGRAVANSIHEQLL